MRSIRFFLVAGILAALILSSFLAALRGYRSSMEQADTLFDNEMLDLAKLISRLDVSRLNDSFRLGNDLAFQIWEDDRLIAGTPDVPRSPIAPLKPGFSNVNFSDYRWRTLARFDPASQRWVIVAERTDLRFALAENVVLASIIPILLTVPLIGLLSWWIISTGLKPLAGLSGELKAKAVEDLSPLKTGDSRQELDQVVQSINGFIARLQEAMEREKRFSADAAHELRTPISVLKIQLHNLGSEIDPQSDSYQELQRGVERMQHLVEQLLSLYRMTPEQFAANLQQVDLQMVVQEVVARQYPQFEAKGQQIEVEGRSLKINADLFALDTLIQNLLSNASKYTPPSGNIRVSIMQRGAKVCLQVDDDGPGIEPDVREQVFERFFRDVRSGDSAQVPGCGLGLTIVRHVAELHKAAVSFHDSVFGHGCGIEVCFPGVNV